MAKKKKKKHHSMPKLSVLDRCVYWLLLAVGMIPCGVCTLGSIFLRQCIAFAEPDVVASRTHVSELWSLPASICLFLVPFIVWYTFYEQRYPIFGVRGLKYGPPAYPRIYPVFMKDKPKFWKSKKEKEYRIHLAIFTAMVTLICCLPLPLSVQGRDVLYADGRVASYNMFGVCTAELDKPDIEAVEFGTYTSKAGKYSHRAWGVDVELRTRQGESFYFQSSHFRGGDEAEVRFWLAAMLDLKDAYPGRVSFEEGAALERVAEDKNLTPQERQLLRELFDIAP